jgi:leucyl-tRNA synthetase
MWQKLGSNNLLDTEPWPQYDKNIIMESRKTLEIPVTVNGKLRTRLQVASGLEIEQVKQIAQEDDKLKPFIEGKQIIKEIYVPDKILNLVVK